LKHGYDLISTEAMQSALGLAYGANRIAGREFNTVLSRIEKNKKNNKEFISYLEKSFNMDMKEAVDFLVNHLKVRQPSLLPYQNIYALLTFFFYLNQSRAKSNQIKEIKKCFGIQHVVRRYSGPRSTEIYLRISNFLEGWLVSVNTTYIISEKVNPLDFLKADYRKASSISNPTFFYLVRKIHPIY
jgi:hypothetical protein